MSLVKKLPEGRKPIEYKWVFTKKYNDKGELEKYKARLVIKGFKQIEGIDYDKIYSPTLSVESMHLVIAIASFKRNIQQLDIKAAYLNAPLNEEIYMTIPEGDPNYKNGFWKLNKALYGLKQAGRMWNITISNFLKNIGFTQLKSEQCLFSKSNSQKETTCIVALYVDDMLITGLDNEINSTVELIKNKFKISKCSSVNHILGITVEPTKYGYNISQKKYINDILKRFKINKNQKSSTPCVGENIKEINNEPFDSSIKAQ